MMSVAIARRNDTTDPGPSEPACPERFVGAGEAPTGPSGCLKANGFSLRSDSCALDYNDLMTHLLALRRERLIALCKEHRVRRLEVFGSAARSDFDPESSDFDLLVEFEDMPFSERADAYLGFLVDVQVLLGGRVDLLEPAAVRNPYLRRGIDESRELLYAA